MGCLVVERQAATNQQTNNSSTFETIFFGPIVPVRANHRSDLVCENLWLGVVQRKKIYFRFDAFVRCWPDRHRL